MKRRNRDQHTTAQRDTQDPSGPHRATVDLAAYRAASEKLDRGAELAPRPIADDELAPVVAELERLRAENARLRGDDAPPASVAQVKYLAGLANEMSRRDAAAVISYLKGWPGWSKRQQSAALMRLQALTGREALDLVPDPRDKGGAA